MTGFDSDSRAAGNVRFATPRVKMIDRRARREVLCNGGCWHSECTAARMSPLALGGGRAALSESSRRRFSGDARAALRHARPVPRAFGSANMRALALPKSRNNKRGLLRVKRFACRRMPERDRERDPEGDC